MIATADSSFSFLLLTLKQRMQKKQALQACVWAPKPKVVKEARLPYPWWGVGSRWTEIRPHRFAKMSWRNSTTADIKLADQLNCEPIPGNGPHASPPERQFATFFRAPDASRANGMRPRCAFRSLLQAAHSVKMWDVVSGVLSPQQGHM